MADVGELIAEVADSGSKIGLFTEKVIVLGISPERVDVGRIVVFGEVVFTAQEDFAFTFFVEAIEREYDGFALGVSTIETEAEGGSGAPGIGNKFGASWFYIIKSSQ